MNSRAFEGTPQQCALWNRKSIRVRPEQGRVLIAHADWSVGESMAVLLELKGFAAMLVTDVFAARGNIAVFDPHAILLDTRVGAAKNYNFAKELCISERATSRLLIALSNFSPDESVDALKAAGYDGHSRRPSPMWQITDLLTSFFQTEN